MKKIVQRVSALLMAGVLTVSMGTMASAAGKKKQVDLKGKYHASMGIQTATELWIEHMAYYDKTQNTKYGTPDAGKLQSAGDDGNIVDHAGTFTDVEIAGNGTYTLKLEGADFSNEQCISQLHIATDIPLNDKIKFSNVVLTINGQQVVEFDEGWMENEDPYLQGGMVVVLLNHWRGELITLLQGKGLSENAENGYNLLQGAGDENISIQFAVSGFDYDNPDAVAETPEPTATPKVEKIDDAEDSDGESGTNLGMVVGIVAAVAVVGGVAVGVIVSRRKK